MEVQYGKIRQLEEKIIDLQKEKNTEETAKNKALQEVQVLLTFWLKWEFEIYVFIYREHLNSASLTLPGGLTDKFQDVMRALEEVALSYDQKAEEAAKTTILQSKLDDAELKSDKLSNVIILHIFLLILKIISIVEKRVQAKNRNRRRTWAQDASFHIGSILNS